MHKPRQKNKFRNQVLPAIVFILLLSFLSCTQSTPEKPLPDGLYLINRIDTVAAEPSALAKNEHAVFFSKMFEEYNEEGYSRIIIDKNEYVPLELETDPIAEQQTEQKKKLLLSLTMEASQKLKTFTAEHIMEYVALVVDGEALTMHRIKVALNTGQLQITRCGDNACERLFVTLKDNVKD